MDAGGGERVTVKSKTPLEKYLELPEGYPAELIGGELKMSPSPDVKHQKVAGSIYRELSKYEEFGEVLCEIDVHFDDENVLRPDIVFIKKENEKVIGERWIEEAPDIVVEVVSQSSAGRDMIIKNIREVRGEGVLDIGSHKRGGFRLRERRREVRSFVPWKEMFFEGS